MLTMMVVALALQARPDPVAEPVITVTATKLSDYRVAVERCIAGSCTPRQDIVYSIRYAEALFRTGDYGGARLVLAKSVTRNRHAAAQEPIALSQLYLAQANVGLHYGDQTEVKRALANSAIVARDYLPADTPDVFLAQLRVADLRSLRDPSPGFTGPYRSIAARAHAANLPLIAALADLHQAGALASRRNPQAAEPLLAGVAALPGEAARPYRVAARVMQARIARERGDKGATEALIAALKSEPLSEATLVYSPPLPNPTDPVITDPFDTTIDRATRSSDLIPLQWVDVGFSIRQDGTVDSPEVLRGSRQHPWSAALLKAVAGRRYTPSSASEAGQYRIERFTVTADFSTPIGSMIRRRVGAPRIEQIDLTDPPTTPAAPQISARS